MVGNILRIKPGRYVRSAGDKLPKSTGDKLPESNGDNDFNFPGETFQTVLGKGSTGVSGNLLFGNIKMSSTTSMLIIFSFEDFILM